MFMWKKNKLLMEQIQHYLDVAQETLDSFSEGLHHYAENGLDDAFSRIVDATHQKESTADGIRREIEVELFKKSLLPESREDLMLLLERTFCCCGLQRAVGRVLRIVRLTCGLILQIQQLRLRLALQTSLLLVASGDVIQNL